MKLRPEDTCGARPPGELKVEKMGWQETKDLLERIKKRALEEAEKGAEAVRVAREKGVAARREKQLEERQREIERRALLQKQLELLAAPEEQEGDS